MSYEIKSDVLPERLTLVKRAHLDSGGFGGWLHEAYGELFSYIAMRKVPVTGPPFGRYAFNGGIGVEAGVPIAARVPACGDLVTSALPSTRAATTCHMGSYDKLRDAYDALEKWVHDHGFERNGLHWEVYLTDPQAQPDPRLRQTIVIMPYRVPT
jgi:effector-binding domain-containing protein